LDALFKSKYVETKLVFITRKMYRPAATSRNSKLPSSSVTPIDDAPLTGARVTVAPQQSRLS